MPQEAARRFWSFSRGETNVSVMKGMLSLQRDSASPMACSSTTTTTTALPLRSEEGPDQTDGGHEGRSGSTEEGRLMVAAGENKRWPRQIVSQFGIRLELGRFNKVRNL